VGAGGAAQEVVEPRQVDDEPDDVDDAQAEDEDQAAVMVVERARDLRRRIVLAELEAERDDQRDSVRELDPGPTARLSQLARLSARRARPGSQVRRSEAESTVETTATDVPRADLPPLGPGDAARSPRRSVTIDRG
jgi:hypothetical protein